MPYWLYLFLSYEIPLWWRIKRGKIPNKVKEWVEYINNHKSEVRFINENTIRTDDYEFSFYDYLEKGLILGIKEFRDDYLESIYMYLLFKHLKKIIKEK
ncbi:hypothetical protein ACLSZP_04905 [Avibacterium avium]|uniref:hypothetical protein n=1 Tax=Avibacterium avium TaxID=751 RepID=UPI003BF851C3